MTEKSLNIRVRGHLLVPFGRLKWDISKITISSVSTDSSYFTSATPCAYIDVAANAPLRFYDIEDCLPDFSSGGITYDENEEQMTLNTVLLVKRHSSPLAILTLTLKNDSWNFIFHGRLSVARQTSGSDVIRVKNWINH